MDRLFQSKSRRQFARGLAIAFGGLAFGLNCPSTASSHEIAETDVPRKLDSPVIPSENASSGVIFLLDDSTYLLFKAVQIDSEGVPVEGTAIIELVGCCERATTHSLDDVMQQPDRPRFFDELDPQSIYEIENSTWLAAVEAKHQRMRPIETHTVDVPLKTVSASGKVVRKKKRMKITVPNLAYHPPNEFSRHFAFMFPQSTFHCLADELTIEFTTEPLLFVLASMQL